jgi:virulence-associated protein VagC
MTSVITQLKLGFLCNSRNIVFTNGHSQAIRLPKDYRVQDNEVFVKKYEDMVLLIPKNSVWSTFSETAAAIYGRIRSGLEKKDK